MKTNFLMIVLMTSAMLMSCEKFDDEAALVDGSVKDAFGQLFPSAKRVDWDVEGNLFVADFVQEKIEGSAWFAGGGSSSTDAWLMTEWDMAYKDLPQAVKDAFAASEYGSWRVDDVDRIERPGVDAVFVVEAENSEQEVVMHFSANGLLLGSALDVEDGGDNTSMIVDPSVLSAVEVAKTFVSNRYADARILDVEVDDGRIDIDIVVGNKHKDVKFDMNGEWLFTESDVLVSELPAAVSLAIASSSYNNYLIDDADFVETPSGDYYLVELEKSENEVNLKISAAGVII